MHYVIRDRVKNADLVITLVLLEDQSWICHNYWATLCCRWLFLIYGEGRVNSSLSPYIGVDARSHR